MSDKYNDDIIDEEIQNEDDDNKYEPEKFCTLCRRSEKQAGKMIDLPNNIHICSDCMQKSFDSMNQQMSSSNFNYNDLFNMPNISMKKKRRPSRSLTSRRSRHRIRSRQRWMNM